MDNQVEVDAVNLDVVGVGSEASWENLIGSLIASIDEQRTFFFI